MKLLRTELGYAIMKDQGTKTVFVSKGKTVVKLTPSVGDFLDYVSLSTRTPLERASYVQMSERNKSSPPLIHDWTARWHHASTPSAHRQHTVSTPSALIHAWTARWHRYTRIAFRMSNLPPKTANPMIVCVRLVYSSASRLAVASDSSCTWPTLLRLPVPVPVPVLPR